MEPVKKTLLGNTVRFDHGLAQSNLSVLHSENGVTVLLDRVLMDGEDSSHGSIVSQSVWLRNDELKGAVDVLNASIKDIFPPATLRDRVRGTQ